MDDRKDESQEMDDLIDQILSLDDGDLARIHSLVDTEIRDRRDEDAIVFALMVNDQEVDRTGLDEDDPEHAMELFMDEFGWREKIPESQRDSVHVVKV